MTARERKIGWADDRSVTALVYGGRDADLLFAHGAGTGQRHRLVAGFAEALAARGRCVATFDYPFTEEGRRRPDRPATLLACHAAVVAAIESPFLGGRSMGGRMASMLVAGAWDGPQIEASGLILHAYPLHPAGRPDRLRADHLSAIDVPLQVVRGSRDALARSDLFDAYLRGSDRVTVVDLEGLDHSFRGRGRQLDDVIDELADAAVSWMDRVGTGPPI